MVRNREISQVNLKEYTQININWPFDVLPPTPIGLLKVIKSPVFIMVSGDASRAGDRRRKFQPFQPIFILLVYLVLDLNPWQSLSVSDGDFPQGPTFYARGGLSNLDSIPGARK
jgi:hypothetical protein